jgi:hypothetical protein
MIWNIFSNFRGFMNAIRIIPALFFLLVWGPPLLTAQEPSIIEYLAECERKYGSDADLVNGEKYFNPYSRSDGTPFLEQDPGPAFITIRGKEFRDQRLKYDIFNQQLVLDYKDLYGSINSLVLRSEWVESFGFGTRFFRKMSGPAGGKGYYQVIHEGVISCYYRWSKQYLLNLNSGVQNYYFTEPLKAAFLEVDGQFTPIRNNRTFLRTFGEADRKSIKHFLRQSKIRVNRADDPGMRHLMEYCNTLTNEAT